MQNNLFANLQAMGKQEFERLGLPTRFDPAWKYTAITDFSKQLFVSGDLPKDYVLNSPLPPTYINGHKSHSSQPLPAGVIILPLNEAVEKYPDLVQAYLGNILKIKHGFHALNTAFLQHGCFVYIPRDTVLHDPIILTHWHNSKQRTMYWRNLVILEVNSVATIIEDYAGEQNTSYVTNVVTEIHVADNANLTHYKWQREGNLAWHMGDVAIQQRANSIFNGHLFVIGASISRNDTQVALCAEGANCILNGIYAPCAEQHMDQHTAVYHNVPHCTSKQDYRGLLAGNARAVFDGYVYVAPHAVASNANQQNKNIILSPLAEVNTSPQLDIFAQDVICTHGATIGQLDAETLFYFATRGIAKEPAMQALITAFLHDHIQQLSDPALMSWMQALLAQQFGE